MKKLLIYTDSRGQHTPRGQNYDVFAVRLAKRGDIEANLLLCPMKWTTTVDFLDYISRVPPNTYDYIILQTGIVDWSPRPQPSAINDLYDNKTPINLGNDQLNTRDYSKKVINNKKHLFDDIFTEKEMLAHLSKDLGVEFEGHPTINMYSLEMAEKYLLPRLQAIDNLLYINSNRFVPGWKGDHARGRPANIGITENYSALFRDALGPEKVIDLLGWNHEDIQRYTCDNIHLTEAGSDLVYEEICRRLNLNGKAFSVYFNSQFKSETYSSNAKDISILRSQKVSQLYNTDSILIIGNGPSTKKLIDFGLHNLPPTIDTFGMGAAYRFFREVKWWPTYYAWCDAKVVHCHRAALTSLIEDPEIPTRRFFFSLPISTNKRFEKIQHCSTGDFCFRKAIELGYRNIYLIGMEGDYVEEIGESRSLTDDEYYELGYHNLFPLFENISKDKQESFQIYRSNLRLIVSTPKNNPNYFFDSYQRKGDVYSLPRSQTHINAWRKSAQFARGKAVNVFNLSESSKIKEFPKITWEEFMHRISTGTLAEQTFTFAGKPIELPKPLSQSEKRDLLKAAGLQGSEKLACLIIGIKFPENDHTRINNIKFLLSWIDHFYGDLFDVLLVEQDVKSKADELLATAMPYVRHEFLYNPSSYNRGWGYNAAIKNFTNAKVVALMDSDILTGANFVQEVIDCHLKYKAVSPYTNVYFTNSSETEMIFESFKLDHLCRNNGVTKPTTISGGILIIRRDVYEQLAGFEQYVEYGGEDRALDVTLLNHCSPDEIRMAPYIYVHLYHPIGNEPRPNWKQVFTHLRKNYGCVVDRTLTAKDFIHKNCSHVSPEQTGRNIIKRRPSYGDRDLYRSGRSLTINGCYKDVKAQVGNSVLFPPEFKNLDYYVEKEFNKSPDPDSERIAAFYNAFKGKRCFIIGNGPSLNKHDLSLLEGEYTFAVNSFFYKTDETGFRPTFFVVEDNAVMKENIERIRAYEVPFKFFPTNYKGLHPEGDNVYFFRMNRGFYEKSSPNYCVPRFSTDASKVLYCGQSVTYINLQLAYFMGFTEVYLIGMDFNYQIPSSHKRQGDLIISTTDDPNHFHKDYFGKGKTWKDPKLDRVAVNYRQAKLVYEAVGRKIYNATIGGKLEIFERVDYERLLGEDKGLSSSGQGEVKAGQSSLPKFGADERHQKQSMPKTNRKTKAASSSLKGMAISTRFRRWVCLRYKDFAEAVRARSLVLFRIGQLVIWSLRAARRYPVASGGILLVVASLAVLPTYAPLWPYRGWFWVGAALTGFSGISMALFAAAQQAFQRLLDIQAGHVEAATRAARQTNEQRVAKLEKRTTILKAELKKAAESAKAGDEALKAEIEKAAESAKAGDEALKAEIEKVAESVKAGDEVLRAEVKNMVKADDQELKKEIGEVIQTEIASLRTELEREWAFSNYGNASALRVHSRKLSEADIEHIRKHWLKLFGLSLSSRQLSYLAHHICLAEERCEGRMATTIQAAMLRTLALLSLQTKRIELLEIGTLFGISAGTLYRAGIRAKREVYMTLIDPLEGYYDRGLTDNHTGVPVTRNTLVSNLSALGVKKTHYRIIQRLSTDREALEAASDRCYDYILVDGDHSLEGVASDFELYGPLVKPGGLLIFDDYDTTDWPAIKPFVDEYVRTDDDWLWIGSGWRTAIFRRKRKGDLV